MPRRLQVYETPDITVTFDPDVCIHSGVCVRGLPLVFDVARKRWIRPELASPDEVAAQVARCPSGALQYQMKRTEVPRVLGDATITTFLATTDAPRAKQFYGTVLGLRLKTEDEFALVFDCNGIELRLQKVKEFEPHPFTALGWRVDSVRETIAALSKQGVRCERYSFLEQDDMGVWQAPSGARVVWFKDPEGNLLSLTEVAR